MAAAAFDEDERQRVVPLLLRQRFNRGQNNIYLISVTVTRVFVLSLLLAGWIRTQTHMSKNENGFAPAFGGDGGTCECRGKCPLIQ